MIKVILLKDAEANRGVVFAQAVVEQNGFMITMATGYLRKPKTLVAAKGSVAMELPDTYKVGTITESFATEATETAESEVRQVTYITIAN